MTRKPCKGPRLLATMFYRYVVQHIRVPGRPNLGFTGQVGDIWWVFMLAGVCSYSGLITYAWIRLTLALLQA